MRLIPACAFVFIFGLGLAGCSAADDSDIGSSDPTANQEEAMKACPYLVPVCDAPCKLVGHCPQKCQCPSGATTACGTTSCTPNQTCCSGMPFPERTCVNGDICPISRAEYKTEIDYLKNSEVKKLHDELMEMPLASYRYKTEDPSARRHLGFIINDVGQSPAVDAAGQRVDLYGYTTMAVAALKEQSAELAELKRQVSDLKKEVDEARSACKTH